MAMDYAAMNKKAVDDQAAVDKLSTAKQAALDKQAYKGQRDLNANRRRMQSGRPVCPVWINSTDGSMQGSTNTGKTCHRSLMTLSRSNGRLASMPVAG